MRFKLDISMDDAALAESPTFELSEILLRLGWRVRKLDDASVSLLDGFKLLDSNGNTVGKVTLDCASKAVRP